jgi:hypothetical protein
VKPIGQETRGWLLFDASVRERHGGSAPALVDTISLATPRLRVAVIARVTEARGGCLGGGPVFECFIADETGELTLLFLGRTVVPGVRVGIPLLAEGTIGIRAGRPVMLNPLITIRAD